MNDFDSVTTRGGDRGESSLLSGERLRKDDLLFETLGDLDELSAAVGVARAASEDKKLNKTLLEIQRKLLTAGAMIASYPGNYSGDIISEKDITALEKLEKRIISLIPPQRGFIYPGDNLPAAHLHLARCICRRLERKIVTCIRERGMGGITVLQRYINRLSDYLFLAARNIEEDIDID